MTGRVFICADRAFPRGDAGANRILFMAKALIEKKWNVFVVSTGKMKEEHYNKQKNCYTYEGVDYQNVKANKNNTLQKVLHNFLDGNNAIKILKQQKIQSSDIILLYTSNYFFSKAIVNFAEKNGIRIAVDIVEWHQDFQYKKGKSDINYKLYTKFFNHVVPKTHNVIAISKCLKEHFESLGCYVSIVPIYIDSDKSVQIAKNISGDKLNLIYPGNPYRKDDLLSMLQAINGMDEASQKRICLHLTGVNEGLLLSCIPGDEGLLKKLINSNNVVLHSWLEYDKLIELYSTIDFALIARPINKVTEANFPSKVPELLINGIPAITNRVGDIVDYLEDGMDSILYNGAGADNCREAIYRALALSMEVRIGMKTKAFETAKTKFSYHLCSDNLHNFFMNIEMRSK